MTKRQGSPLSGKPCKLTPISSNTFVNEDLGLPSPRTQEPSHDGTVFLPSPLSTSALVRYQPPDAFPIFKNGDVIITTDLGPSPQTFQLHSSVLCRNSPFIATKLLPDETRPTWYHFTIEEIDGKIGMGRKQVSGDRPTVSHHGPQIIDGTHIKLEDSPDAGTSPHAPPSTALVAANAHHFTAIACYTQILGSFYNIPPKLSTTNITTALTQSESLIKIAIELGCLHLLQAHLSSIYVNYRQSLYHAISADAPRWLALSLALENRAIYTECLIHLVGAHPKLPWPTRHTAIPDPVQHLIAQKARDLATLRGDVERELLLVTLHIHDLRTRRDRPFDPREKAEIEPWIVVQVFRDEIAQHISKVDKHPEASVHLGKLYRGISKGSFNWLSTEYVREMVMPTMKLEWKDLGEDMKKLRASAATAVERLADNQLMIDPDAHGVGYLTCVKVGDRDIPWLVGGE